MTLPGLTAQDEMLPVHFVAPPVNPLPTGLYAAVQWQADPMSRFMHGVEVRGPNYGGADAFGVWDSPYCGTIVTIDLDGASGGNFDLTVDGVAVNNVAWNASAPTLDAALEAVVGAGNVSVTAGAPGYVVTFKTWHTVVFNGTDLTGDGGDSFASSERKMGSRPDILDPFDPITVWGYDECDLTAPSRAEVAARAAQILRIEEGVAVEREFADRIKYDAGTPGTADDLLEAVSDLEAALAVTNTVGIIHASPAQAAYAAQAQLLVRSGGGFTTPMGHRWVFGGGYAEGLGATLVATSAPIFGWRDEPTVRTAIDEKHNTFVAIAERSVTIGYEAAIAAVTIT